MDRARDTGEGVVTNGTVAANYMGVTPCTRDWGTTPATSD